MSDLRARVDAELEAIEEGPSPLPGLDRWSALSRLELAGIVALLHNFYYGVENSLKLLVVARGRSIPSGSAWHRDLVNLCATEGILEKTLLKDLQPYLAFRHFFSHGYAVELDPRRLEPLVLGVHMVYEGFRKAVERSRAG